MNKDILEHQWQELRKLLDLRDEVTILKIQVQGYYMGRDGKPKLVASDHYLIKKK